MNCQIGDYAYITKGDFAGLVVEVMEKYAVWRATNETIWGVRSHLADGINFSCSDCILCPISRETKK